MNLCISKAKIKAAEAQSFAKIHADLTVNDSTFQCQYLQKPSIKPPCTTGAGHPLALPEVTGSHQDSNLELLI